MNIFYRFIYTSTFLLLSSGVKAQMPTPPLSTTIKTETTIGFTSIKLEYSRPSRKGRIIFGDFVPYNEIWRTGANKNAVISFSDDVIFGGTAVKKGTYAIYSKPNKTIWEIYLYSEIENIGLPKTWEESKIVAKCTANPMNIPTVETFTINIGNVTNSTFQLEIMWENVLVPVKIEVPTEKKVSATISKALSGPSAWDYFFYARYYQEDKQNLNQALTWINKSIEMLANDGDIYMPLRIKSLIEADMGNYKSAIFTAEQSLEKAKQANNNEYVALNIKSIQDWSRR